MNKVYSSFYGFDMAERACGGILERVPGILRVGARRIDRGKDLETQSVDDDDLFSLTRTFAPEMAFQTGYFFSPGSNFLTAAADLPGDDDAREGAIEPMRAQKYLVCAEGHRPDVEKAAHILRSLGGHNVNICDTSGDFLDAGIPEGTNQ